MTKLQKEALMAAIYEIQFAVMSHEKGLKAETENEQHQHSEALKKSLIQAIKWLDCLSSEVD